jgi:Kelch motif
MQTKKIKLLFTGKKGILLQNYPSSIEELYKIIENYYQVNPNNVQITFEDTEKDECEILDNLTYIAACSEFTNKVILNITVFNSTPISRINSIIVPEDRKTLKFFKTMSRDMALFDVERETIQWITFPMGIMFKEYAAWIDLPTGEIFYCGGGHPISSNEVYLLNPYTQTYKILPNMLNSRHSHAIAYSNGSVYILGGIKNMIFLSSKIKDCEKYSLDQGKWEKIYDLDTPRADVAAIAINDYILVLGRGSQYLVEYNSESLKVDLKEDYGGCMTVVDNMIYVFQGSKVKVYGLENKNLIYQYALPRKQSWWSHCPPICHQEFIYFVWWEEPGWVCRFNRSTAEFKKVTSLFY